MSANHAFFISCFRNEIASTASLFRSLPADQLDYRPHAVSRSAREIVEHLLTHLVDMAVIPHETVCEETLTYPVSDPADAAAQYEALCGTVLDAVSGLSAEQWETVPVELRIHGTPVVTLPRTNMMWFFFFDIIHHRGQLSTYVRPMGGAVPSIYGPSADTSSAGA